MKIDTEGSSATITIEDPEAQAVFVKGRENPKYWRNTTETYEISKFLETNREFAQVFVNINGNFTRVK